MWPLEKGGEPCPAWASALPPPGGVTMGKLLQRSVPRFLRLQSGSESGKPLGPRSK